jgi:hypothetical protein
MSFFPTYMHCRNFHIGKKFLVFFHKIRDKSCPFRIHGGDHQETLSCFGIHFSKQQPQPQPSQGSSTNYDAIGPSDIEHVCLVIACHRMFQSSRSAAVLSGFSADAIPNESTDKRTSCSCE